MHADNRRIDYLHRRIMRLGKCVHHPVPDATPSPAAQSQHPHSRIPPAAKTQLGDATLMAERRAWAAKRAFAELGGISRPYGPPGVQARERTELRNSFP